MYRAINVLKSVRVLQAHKECLQSSGLRSFSAAGDKHSLDRIPKAPEDGSSVSSSGSDELQPGLPTVRLSTRQKRYILLAFKHKTMADIPDTLTVKQIDSLYQRSRITVNLMLGVVVLMLCLVTVSLGRRDAAAGETLEKINLDWHKKHNQEYKEEQERKRAKE